MDWIDRMSPEEAWKFMRQPVTADFIPGSWPNNPPFYKMSPSVSLAELERIKAKAEQCCPDCGSMEHFEC